MEEIWKTHPKIDERYEFSNFGQFRNTETKQLLKQSLNKENHVVTTLKFKKEGKRKKIRLARIIAEIFVPNPDPINNKIIIHKDGNSRNNYFDNLRWSTTKETVDISFKNGNRISNFEVLTNNQIIDIRKSFDETEITKYELSKKYNTTIGNITSILKYRTRINIDETRPYKINQLKGDELESFLNIKIIRSKLLENQRRKNKTLNNLIISDNILNIIAYDYVNTSLSIKELAYKHKANLKALKFQFKTIELPSITTQDGEIFSQINEITKISNFGRVTINGKLSIKRRFNFNGVSKGIRKIVGELFVYNPDNYTNLNSIDGNIQNIHHNNLEWVFPNKPQYLKTEDGNIPMVLWDGVMIPLMDVKDEIIQEYLNSTEFIDFRAKYLIGYTLLYQLLRPYMKEKRHGIYYCESCGENNERYFYGKRLNICKTCISEGKAVERLNLRPENRRAIAIVRENWKNKNQVKLKLSGAKTRAKSRNFDYNLDEDFIRELFEKQNGLCAYSGKAITLNRNDSEDFFSIDRVDSNKGYTKDNVKLVTGYINRMKLDLVYSDFLEIIKTIYEFNFPKTS